jgi:hypothetical protein
MLVFGDLITIDGDTVEVDVTADGSSDIVVATGEVRIADHAAGGAGYALWAVNVVLGADLEPDEGEGVGFGSGGLSVGATNPDPGVTGGVGVDLYQYYYTNVPLSLSDSWQVNAPNGFVSTFDNSTLDTEVWSPDMSGCGLLTALQAQVTAVGSGTITGSFTPQTIFFYSGLTGWGVVANSSEGPVIPEPWWQPGLTDGQQTATVGISPGGGPLPLYTNSSGQFYAYLQLQPCDAVTNVVSSAEWLPAPTVSQFSGWTSNLAWAYQTFLWPSDATIPANDTGSPRTATITVTTTVGDYYIVFNQGTPAPPPPGGGGNGNGSRTLDADLLDDVLSVAWVDATSGALYTSVHRGPIAYIGNGTKGWETPQAVETANCAAPLGLLYLPNSRLYLSYGLSSSQVWRYHEAHGGSGSPDWSASTSGGQSIACKGRSGEIAWIAQSGTTLGYSRSQGLSGATWTTPVAAVSGAVGIGVAWVEVGLAALYYDSSGNLWRLLAANPEAQWPAATAVTGLSGQLVDLKCASNGVLVGLLWDWNGTSGTQTFRACRSRDLGQTWEMDTEAIAAIPALAQPPVIVTQEHYLFAVWQSGNAPAFACSQDAGATWS